MAFGLRREAIHQIDNDEAAKNWRQDDPIPEPAWPLEDVGVIGDLEHAIEHRVVDEADERAQQDRAHPREDPDAQSQKAQREQTDTPLFPVACGGLGRNGGVSSR
jgi:hypothetical protein